MHERQKPPPPIVNILELQGITEPDRRPIDGCVARAESNVQARSVARSSSEGKTTGESSTTGTSEAFEPVYADLPVSFHGMDKLVAMSGKFLMGLPDGRACISFVDRSQATRGFLKVPLVTPPPLDDHTLPPQR